MNSATGRVLITGASGYIGGRLAVALRARDVPLRLLSRRPESLAAFAGPNVEIVQGDVMDRASLRHALRGVSSAYYLVHSMGAADAGFADLDRYAVENFVAEAAHLERIVYLGGLGRPSDQLSPHLRSRHEVGEILLAGRAPATVLRAGIVIGRGSASFIMLLSLVRRLPVMVCPRWVETRTQPIGIDDTIAYLMAAVETDAAASRTLDIGGPEVLTYRQMLMRTARLLGRRPRIVVVPVLTPKLSAYWVDFVTPIPASVAHPLIEGLRNEAVVQDGVARDIMPIPLTSFDEAVRRAIGVSG